MINPDIMTPKEILDFQKIILSLMRDNEKIKFSKEEKEILLKAIDYVSNSSYISLVFQFFVLILKERLKEKKKLKKNGLIN